MDLHRARLTQHIILQTDNPDQGQTDVGNACVQAVYHKGQQFVPEAHARQDPASVPDVVLAWVQALSGLDQAQRIQQAVLHLLNSRPGQTQAKSAQVSLALASTTHISKYQDCGSEYLPDSSGASRQLHKRQPRLHHCCQGDVQASCNKH